MDKDDDERMSDFIAKQVCMMFDDIINEFHGFCFVQFLGVILGGKSRSIWKG